MTTDGNNGEDSGTDEEIEKLAAELHQVGNATCEHGNVRKDCPNCN